MSDQGHGRGEKFLELFNKGKEFTEELLKENERLRFRLARLEQAPGHGSAEAGGSLQAELMALRSQLDEVLHERKLMEERYQKVEEENKDFAHRYLEIEEQNNNLANLYVASYQLHSTLDFREVIQIVMEIIINLIGAEIFTIQLLDEKSNELKTISCEGGEAMAGMDVLSVKLGDGIIGDVAKTGESYYINQDSGEGPIDLTHPLAAIPLKIKEHVIGVIVIYRLLQQKDAFTAVDFELFSLLAGHAATAIFGAKLYTGSERKLSTIQSFLDLLTTT